MGRKLEGLEVFQRLLSEIVAIKGVTDSFLSRILQIIWNIISEDTRTLILVEIQKVNDNMRAI